MLHAKSLQSYPTLCDPMDSSPSGSTVHRILQARILEWVVVDLNQLKDLRKKTDFWKQEFYLKTVTRNPA